jgi:hypothetical protein
MKAPLRCYSQEEIHSRLITYPWKQVCLSACILLAFVFSSIVISFIKIQGNHNDYGFISHVTRLGLHPLKNYFLFGALTISFLFILSGVLCFKKNVLRSIAAIVCALQGYSRFLGTIALALFCVFAIAVPLLNLLDLNPVRPLSDPFHEGERFGYLFSYLARHSINDIFVIHGVGLNLFPVYLAHRITPNGSIAVTNLIMLCLKGFGILCAWLIVFFTASFADHRLSFKKLAVSWLCLTAVLSVSDRILIDARESFLLFQVLLLIVQELLYRKRRIVLSMLCVLMLGILTPLSFVFSFDRSLYAAAIIIASLLMIVIMRKQGASIFIGPLFLGLFTSSAALWHFFTSDNVRALCQQTTFWIKYGKYMSNLPMGSIINNPIEYSLLVANVIVFCLMVISLVVLYLKIKKIKLFLTTYFPLIILALTSLFYLRVALDRTEIGHFIQSSVGLLLFFSSLLIWKINPEFTFNTIKNDGRPYLARLSHVVFLLFSVLLLLMAFNPFKAKNSLANIYRAVKTPNELLIPEAYKHTVKKLNSLIKKDETFYTLTSEGIWYFLLQKKSSSKFHQLIYCRTTECQIDLIGDLKKTSPPYLLFSNNYWSSNIDNVSIFNSHHVFLAYIMKSYGPSFEVEGNWIWKKRDDSLVFSNRMIGISQTYDLQLRKKVDGIIQGRFADGFSPNETSCVFLTLGDRREMVAAKLLGEKLVESGTWAIEIPTAFMENGANSIEVWGGQNRVDTLYRLCEPIKITVTD